MTVTNSKDTYLEDYIGKPVISDTMRKRIIRWKSLNDDNKITKSGIGSSVRSFYMAGNSAESLFPGYSIAEAELLVMKLINEDWLNEKIIDKAKKIINDLK
jgi:hypothetical protein